MKLHRLKLLGGTMILSLGLVACGDNASMGRRNKTEDLSKVKTEKSRSAVADGVSIEGNYVSLQPKGHIDADGKEVIEGHILNYYTIIGGRIYGHEIDLDKKTFTSFVNTYGIVKSEDFSEVQMLVEQISCDQNGKSLKAGRDDMGSLSETFSPEIEVNDRGLVFSLDGKKEAMLKISQEDADAINVALMEFEGLMGENNNCSKQSAKLDRAEESMDKVQAVLNEVLAKN